MTKNSTQLDNQETTDQQSVYTDFRSWCLHHHTEENEATIEAISKRDSILGQDHLVNYQHCRTRAWFSVNLEDRQVRIATNNCRERWCVICSGALTKYRTRSVTEWLEQTENVRFLTLTLKHSDDPLQTQIKDLYYYFRQFRKTIDFKYHVWGGIWFFQIKRSKRSGGWHPHLHCLVHGRWWNKVAIADLWKKITLGSFIVDIRTIRDKIAKAEYVARYSSRPCLLSTFSLPDRLDVIESLFRRRLCGTWGTGRTCSLSSKIKIDRNSWVNVGTFKTVMTSKPYHAFSKAIFESWRNNEPLDEGISMSIYDRLEQWSNAYDIPELEYLSYFESDVQ